MSYKKELQPYCYSTETPRIIIAALKGGSGKTLFSVAIIAYLKEIGKKVVVYKKGPDYIDAGWLALAAGRPCYNLDNFLISNAQVKDSFISNTQSSCNIAIIEGNRGIFDGLDTDGSTSTAGLAKLLDSPVILCLDCTKTTRTIAAVLKGCLIFDPEVKIKGVLLNRVGGTRHEKIIRESIEKYCKIPVLGAIPKLKENIFPERHMGLVPTQEHEWAENSLKAASIIAQKYIDIDKVIEIAQETSILKTNTLKYETSKIEVNSKPKIAVIRDSVFQFYYQENLDALRREGGDLVFISPLTDMSIPSDIGALYIGGGFPETHAESLASNQSFKDNIKQLAENGMPIYGECGGLMYLSESIAINDKKYPMVKVLPIEYSFSKRPCAHGYTIIKVEKDNPYFQVGDIIKGHEFHYSKVEKWKGKDDDLIFSMKRGVGLINKKDGARYKNVLGTYTHIHSIGTPNWSKSLIKLSIHYVNSK